MQVHDVIKPVCDSFIGWLGGKTRLRTTIINCMPPHKCYVETFAGSATVFFGKPPSMSKDEIINDIHGELVNLMKVISGTCFDEDVRQEFIRYVRTMPAAREAFEDWKHWDEDKIKKLNNAQRAFRFYYCVKKGFSCIPKGGYEASPISSNRYNMSTEFDKFSDRFKAKDAQIEHMEYDELIEKYNRPDCDSFFFMDPPYVVATSTNYYEFIFDDEKHQKMKDCCDKISRNNNKLLITYDDHPKVLDLYSDKHYFIYRTDPIVYSSSDERGERGLIKKELFISNYDIAKMVHTRNTRPKARRPRHGDIFDKLVVTDKRIDVPGHIGLDRIQ